MLEENLVQIGFSRKEAKVYLELLKLGPQAVSVIAKRINVNRTTAYSVIKSLVKKGVVSQHSNGTLNYFVASDPNALAGFLDRKSKTYEYYRDQIMTLLPKFRGLLPSHCPKRPVVSFFDGIEGVKRVMNDALNAEGEFRSCLALEKWFKSDFSDFLIKYKNIRIKNKKVPLKAMAPDAPEVRAFFNANYDKNSSLTEVLYVDPLEFSSLFEMEFNVYNDRVAIISLDKGCEYAVIIESKLIADMQKMMFDAAWSKFKK